MDLIKIREQAEKEVLEERHRSLVDAEKEKIRFKIDLPWFIRLFPWRLRVMRLDVVPDASEIERVMKNRDEWIENFRKVDKINRKLHVENMKLKQRMAYYEGRR